MERMHAGAVLEGEGNPMLEQGNSMRRKEQQSVLN